MSCTKPARTCLEQLEILKGRGLLVTDGPRALHCLAHQNCYRLSAYRFPLTVPGQPDQFLPGTTPALALGLCARPRPWPPGV